jgi:cobalt/nickel transport protein
MTKNLLRSSNRAVLLTGLGVALLIAVFLSPFSSQNPDGLERVSQDLKFADRKAEGQVAKKLPFYAIFDEYALRGVPEAVAIPLAGLLGTVVTFGLSWGVGKLFMRGHGGQSSHDSRDSAGDA